MYPTQIKSPPICQHAITCSRLIYGLFLFVTQFTLPVLARWERTANTGKHWTTIATSAYYWSILVIIGQYWSILAKISQEMIFFQDCQRI